MSRTLQPLSLAFGLALGAVVAYGLGVMALPLVLPAMLSDLGWSRWHGGLLAAATAGGYVTGLVLVLPRHRATPSGRVFQLALVVAAASLVTTGAVRDVNHLVLLRFISGMAAAALVVSGTRLAAAIFVHEPVQSARMVALFRSGLPAGVVVAGLVTSALLATLGARGWPEMWLVLGLLSLCALPFVMWSCRHVVSLPPSSVETDWPARRFVPLIIARAVYAAASIAVLTFLALRMLESGAGVAAVAVAWTLMGLGGLAAPVVWRRGLPNLATERRIALAMVASAAGVSMIALSALPGLLAAGAALMGIGAFGVPALMDDCVHETVPREHRDAARAGLAVVHGFSQPVGVLLAAWIAEGAYGLPGCYLSAAAAMVLASLAALLQQAYTEWLRTAPTGPAPS